MEIISFRYSHYSERQDKLFPLQIKPLNVNLQLNCGFKFVPCISRPRH